MERIPHATLIDSDPEKLGGIPVFRGTRVPVQNLFEYLEAGDSLAVFLKSMSLLLDECVPKR